MINRCKSHLLMLLFIALYCMMVLIVIVMADNNDRVRLKDIQTLTFHSASLTKSRRNQTISQLKCIGNGHCNSVNISTVTCYNNGTNGPSIHWQCKAQMPSNYKFGQLDMSCEGYDSPQDEYILAGSCSLQYSIVERSHAGDAAHDDDDDDDDGGFLQMSSMKITLIAVLILFSCCCCCFCCPGKRSKPIVNRATTTKSQSPSKSCSIRQYSSELPGSRIPSRQPLEPSKSHRIKQYSSKLPRSSVAARQSFEPSKSYRIGQFSSESSEDYSIAPQQPLQQSNSYKKEQHSSKSSAISIIPGILGGAAAGGFMGYLFGSSQDQIISPNLDIAATPPPALN
ncbi:uncharacterized protein LOC113794092 [Dermatophagoides pteronyssinus]|uniref:uncharacterized protein LOC113794092 n=1 Tax=Dermatophagoides pteronyssinus TaxID=6956 RepID=UPI003F66F381